MGLWRWGSDLPVIRTRRVALRVVSSLGPDLTHSETKKTTTQHLVMNSSLTTWEALKAALDNVTRAQAAANNNPQLVSERTGSLLESQARQGEHTHTQRAVIDIARRTIRLNPDLEEIVFSYSESIVSLRPAGRETRAGSQLWSTVLNDGKGRRNLFHSS